MCKRVCVSYAVMVFYVALFLCVILCVETVILHNVQGKESTNCQYYCSTGLLRVSVCNRAANYVGVKCTGVNSIQ